MNVVLEFSGGAELLFGKTRQHQVQLPTSESKWTIGKLLAWIKDNLLQERPELFLKDPSSPHLDVRPGILVLVNDADWELLGQTEYELEVSKIKCHFDSFDITNENLIFRKVTISHSFPHYTGVNLISSPWPQSAETFNSPIIIVGSMPTF